MRLMVSNNGLIEVECIIVDSQTSVGNTRIIISEKQSNSYDFASLDDVPELYRLQIDRLALRFHDKKRASGPVLEFEGASSALRFMLSERSENLVYSSVLKVMTIEYIHHDICIYWREFYADDTCLEAFWETVSRLT